MQLCYYISHILFKECKPAESYIKSYGTAMPLSPIRTCSGTYSTAITIPQLNRKSSQTKPITSPIAIKSSWIKARYLSFPVKSSVLGMAISSRFCHFCQTNTMVRSVSVFPVKNPGQRSISSMTKQACSTRTNSRWTGVTKTTTKLSILPVSLMS